MEEILNQLILIDDECKIRLKELQDKKENIEYLVNDELTKRKDEVKTKYKFKIDMRKNEYEIKLAENMKKIEEERMQEIQQIINRYEQAKESFKQLIIQSII